MNSVTFVNKSPKAEIIKIVSTAGNNALNADETFDGTDSGILIANFPLSAKRQYISIETIATIIPKNNPCALVNSRGNTLTTSTKSVTPQLQL